MRTHGWSGSKPSSDEEAVERILAAAKRAIDHSGPDFSIVDVARDLGVTRQTVYRYFPSTEALLTATAIGAVGPFLDNMAIHLTGLHDPGEAVVESIVYVLERLPHDPYLSLLMSPGSTLVSPARVTSDVALAFGRLIIDRFDIDWPSIGFDDADINGLVEHTLRTLQSFIIDPGRPPRLGDDLRNYLRLWVAPAIPGTQIAKKETHAPRHNS
ncbi:TetR/AcrR family transcriptional regulator [Mycobacterium spongiae]|uniref:TetR family transcriptional regulator n=1 Tax=Mycobacterium spongiae TaxID=886343 RepID=A0A975K1W5_9MYCO|nr:TetR/AcrR family transcriptional regulator [Mycobacterium spongiae]QUR69856.1 TetR family transcriptional regulator [Mycobacterium spongiae]